MTLVQAASDMSERAEDDLRAQSESVISGMMRCLERISAAICAFAAVASHFHESSSDLMTISRSYKACKVS